MWILRLEGLNTVCFWFIFHTHHFRFILLFKVAKLKYGGRENQKHHKKKIKKRNERRGLTRTPQQLMPILMTLCMHDRRILHFDWVHLTNLMVFSVLAGTKYKSGDGQFIVGEISFLTDSDCR